jgi:hypothetical protein
LVKPRVIREFIEQYNSSPLPPHDIALNVLEGMGVPSDRADAVLALILEGADSVGYVSEIKGKKYIEVVRSSSPAPEDRIPADLTDLITNGEDASPPLAEEYPAVEEPSAPPPLVKPDADPEVLKRVFITHGKDKSLLPTIKDFLGLIDMETVIAVDRDTVAKPLSDKVMDDMRSCGAGIIHVTVEKTVIDKEEKKHQFLNPNVLIEIGAAMALYGKRFILLVNEDVQLPSNLKDLYQVRYKGKTLEASEGFRLIQSVKDLKNHKLPGQ